MKALELSDALRDFAAIYGDLDVIFYNITNEGEEEIKADALLIKGDLIVLDAEWVADEVGRPDGFITGYDFAYKKGGEWIDGKRSTD